MTVAETAAPIRARNGPRVLPEHTFTACPLPHVLIVPGGFGTRALLKNAPVLAWFRNQAAAASTARYMEYNAHCS
jgi:putative intracellular protease/amidase